MDMLSEIIDRYSDEEFLKADGFDEAIIGVCSDMNAPVRLVYSVSRYIRILEKQGMSYDEAREYFDFNVSGAYVGEQTPVWYEDSF